MGPVEADPEYQLIVEANNITVEIDNEISKWDMGHQLMINVKKNSFSSSKADCQWLSPSGDHLGTGIRN